MSTVELSVKPGPNGTVEATPNPLVVAIGQTVHWAVDPRLRGAIAIEFTEVRRLPDGKPGSKLPDESARVRTTGPFDTLTLEDDTVGKGPLGRRYIYKIMRDGSQISWAPGNELGGGENFGGIDIPMPPDG